MAISFLVPNRTVLLISDDALYIYSVSGKRVNLVEVVPWDAPNFSENVATVLSKDCGKKPVLLLSDVVEQHYRKEKILKTGVGTLDKSSMLKRRLAVAFGKYPVRAALKLKEKIPKTQAQPGADIYLFAAIPDTEQLDLVMASVRRSMVSVAGLGLLPVEAADMVGLLAEKNAKKSKDKTKGKATWSILIGEHRGENLRQVVTKNGELALTRMTPIAADRNDTMAWANEIGREFEATMSYLSRFGYEPSQGLDVTVIGNMEVAEMLETLIGENCNLTVMTTSQAADNLGLSLGPQSDQTSADTLHVAWAARKSRLSLPMKAGRVDEVHKPRQIAMACTMLLILGALFQSYQFFTHFTEVSSISSDIDDSRKRKAQLDSQYQLEVQKKEELGFDVRLIQSAIAVYDQLEERDIDALPLFKGIGKALGPDMRVDSVNLKQVGKPSVSRFLKPDQRPPAYSLEMKITYPGTTDIDRGNEEVKDTRDRLAKQLVDHKVTVTKYLKDYEYTEGLVLETGDLKKENLQQDFVAEIVIDAPQPKEEKDK